MRSGLALAALSVFGVFFLSSTIAQADDFSFRCQAGDKAKCIQEFNERTTTGEFSADLCGVTHNATTCKPDRFSSKKWVCKVKNSSCLETGLLETGSFTDKPEDRKYECQAKGKGTAVYVVRKEWNYLEGKGHERANTYVPFCVKSSVALGPAKSQGHAVHSSSSN